MIDIQEGCICTVDQRVRRWLRWLAHVCDYESGKILEWMAMKLDRVTKEVRFGT